MKLVAGREGLSNLVDWVHVVEEMDYVHFLKGRELIITTGIKEPDDAQLLEFTQRVYATGASGLVFNVGRYIRQKKCRNLVKTMIFRCLFCRGKCTWLTLTGNCAI